MSSSDPGSCDDVDVLGGASPTVALRAAWLLDGRGGSPVPDPVVVVADGTIISVGSGIEVRVGSDQEICRTRSF